MNIKAVLDTNVLISGIFWSGAPFAVLQAWRQQRFVLTLSLPILEEYRRVLEEMSRKHSLHSAAQVLKLIELYAEMVTPVSFARAVCSDPDDDKFLEAAIAARAGYVVSGDAALLQLKNYQHIEIVRPAQFLNAVLC